MQRNYPLAKGNLLTGGFMTTGLSGIINPHIKGVKVVSETQVDWTVENEYGETYLVTVTATIPDDPETYEPDTTQRVNPQISITRVTS